MYLITQAATNTNLAIITHHAPSFIYHKLIINRKIVHKFWYAALIHFYLAPSITLQLYFRTIFFFFLLYILQNI